MYRLFFFALLIHLNTLVAQPGIDADKLRDLLELCDSTRADEVALYHRGHLVTHWRRNGDCTDRIFNTTSMVKSWTGIVAGILIEEGTWGSVDDPICDYLPEWKAGCRNQVTLRDLLTMSAGLNQKSGGGILAEADMNAYALQVEPDTLPGLRFSYSNASVHLLGMAMESATGQSAQAVFSTRLFDPLGMDSTHLYLDEAGNYATYGGAQTTVQDAARVGLLLRNDGIWEGERLISEDWLKEMVRPSEQAPYYGYLWWLDLQSENPSYAAMGDFGKLTIVFPGLDLVFVRAQTCDLLADYRMQWMGPGFLKAIADVVR